MKNKRSILTGVIIIAIAALLLPVMIHAGSLEPPAAPAPTMRTLDEVYSTGSWSRKIPCDSPTNCLRFEVLADFNNEAVLDKETGLVWEKSPYTTKMDWDAAISQCWNNRSIGNRVSWRLPAIEELSSLVDKAQTYPALSVGHPFANVQGYPGYWSTTTIKDIYFTDITYGVNFDSGGKMQARKGFEAYVWCVLGGAGSDGYYNE